MKRTFLILLITVIAAACGGGNGEQPFTSNSYICGYYEYDAISSYSESVNINGTDYQQINVYIPKAIMVSDVFGNRKHENGMYSSYCKKHNDTSYTRNLVYGANMGVSINYCYPHSDVAKINISCEESWDGAHTEGSSLNDIAYFTALSAYPFVQNSYREYKFDSETLSDFFLNTSKINYSLPGSYPIDKPVSELSREDLKLLGHGQMAQPGGVGYEAPDVLYYYPDILSIPKEQLFAYDMFTVYIPASETKEKNTVTVTLTLDDGKILETSIDL